MKKALFVILAVLLAITLALLIYLKRPLSLGESRAAELVPGDSVALFQLTDFERTRQRWTGTALYKISEEPEVKAFLEKPKSKIPANADFDGKWERVKKIQPKEAFVAITSITDKEPKFVAGFDYKGARGDAESLMSDLKSQVKAQFPGGKSDIVQYDSREIETFQYEDTFFASVFKNHWFLVSNDIELLKTAMQRLDGKLDAKTSLRENAAYKTSIAKLPEGADTLCFVQPQTLITRLSTLIAVSNPNFDSKQLDEWKKIQAISAGMKLDGEKIRDSIYILQPGGGQPSMARNSLSFSSADTLLYFATVLNLNGTPKLPDPALDTTGILTMLAALQHVLEGQGLSYADFKDAFGPEFGTVLDWPAGALQPLPLLSLDVRDGVKARKFVDILANGQAGLPAWAPQDIDGTHYYSMPSASAGFVAVQPVLALTDKALLFGLSLDSVQKAVQSAKSGGSRLDKTPDFKGASDLVAKPTGAFTYIDTKGLFERIYGLASNALKMMAVFNPNASAYADLGKLPSTEAVSKHLSPIICSMATDNNGTLIESAGPVTLNQAFLSAAVAGAAFYKPAAHFPAAPTGSFPQAPAQQASPAPAIP